ncbi:MAG TPA: biopolymer transporter ExbD [Polyangiaceae bacterium]|nr:biopolymer transporter ExbD [Polyangiaceae bacterium]
MAQANSSQDEAITSINVTPLVDVVLVLLVVLMVTASYIATRSIPLNLPKGSTGESAQAPLTVSLDPSGQLYVDGQHATEDELRGRIQRLRAANATPKAMIAADGAVPHRNVVALLDLLRQEKVTQFAINVSPDDLAAKPR